MSRQAEKALQTVNKMVALLVALLLGAGVVMLCRNPKAWIDLAPTSWLSEEDKKAIKDPEAANKEAREKMGREAWEQYKSQQPARGWDQGWKK
jgi:hypothetical protein